MKSIIQEASSIEKAIKQGIEKAGNPRDFAVKVLEYPEKNFFGITTRPAKVAIYCEERTGRSQREPHTLPPSDEQRKSRHEQQRAPSRSLGHESRQDNYSRKQATHMPRHESRESRTEHTYEQRREPRELQERSYKADRAERGERSPSIVSVPRREAIRHEEPIQPRWNDELVRNAEQWLTTVLHSMSTPVLFTTHIDSTCLHITLDRPLFDDLHKERKVLSSLSLLLIETSKHTFSTNLRGHRVLLSHRTSQ